MMKRPLLATVLVVGITCLSNSYAMPNTIQKIKTPVRSCTDPRFAQFFKFYNQNKNGVMYFGAHLGLDSGKGYFNLDTNLNEITPINPNSQSSLYKISFTGNKAVLTGQLESFSNSSVDSLCQVAFSCECQANVACEAWVETLGSRCNIAGSGTESDPYIIQMQ